MKTQEMRSRITSGGLDRAFDYLYSEKAPLQRERYEAAVGEFEKLFGAGREVGLFSARGAPRWAATTPTTSRDGCWPQASTST